VRLLAHGCFISSWFSFSCLPLYHHSFFPIASGWWVAASGYLISLHSCHHQPTLPIETPHTPAPRASNDAMPSETPTTPKLPKQPAPGPTAIYFALSQKTMPLPRRPQMSTELAPDSANAMPQRSPLPAEPPEQVSQTPATDGSSLVNSTPPAVTNKRPGSLQTAAVRSNAWAGGVTSQETIPQRRSAGNWPQRTTPHVSSLAINCLRPTRLSSAYPPARRNSLLATPASPTTSRAPLPAISRCTILRIRQTPTLPPGRTTAPLPTSR